MPVSLARQVGLVTNVGGLIYRYYEREISYGVVLQTAAGYMAFCSDLPSRCGREWPSYNKQDKHEGNGNL